MPIGRAVGRIIDLRRVGPRLSTRRTRYLALAPKVGRRARRPARISRSRSHTTHALFPCHFTFTRVRCNLHRAEIKRACSENIMRSSSNSQFLNRRESVQIMLEPVFMRFVNDTNICFSAFVSNNWNWQVTKVEWLLDKVF